MGLSRTTVKRVFNEDLGLRAYPRKTGHRLNARLMDLRLKRCRALLKYAGKKYQVIPFSDEKKITVEESYNKQNDKVYAHSSEEASNRIPRVQRGHFPSSLMVWLGVSYWGLTEALVFQQDSAPAHRAKSTQDWLAAREIDFIRHEDWPSSSPDLSPLDYKICNTWRKRRAQSLNVEPSGSGERNCTPLAQTNIDEVMTPCVMTPPAKKKLEYIKNSEDELLPMIMTQPSCTPSPPRQLDVGTFIPLSQVESVESVKKPIIKDTGGGAPGCLLRRPVTSILKCRKNNFGASPVAVRRSIKMLSEEKLQCTKEKEKILEESNRRAEEEHIKKLDHAQELHDQLIKHNEERHHKEMLLLDLKIKIHEAQLKKLD
ncbi:hypothetical protein evm_014769 [Chilo suppressalis]|nr:hypothetical protein evm_014769 [Chilo suppressalis]